jgi:hypothetical protein
LKKGQEILHRNEDEKKSSKSKMVVIKIGLGMVVGGHINGHYPGNPIFPELKWG